MLSHDEDRNLKAIEKWFEESDPAFTRMLRQHEPPRRSANRTAVRIAVDLAGGALFLVGAATALPVLVVLGFLVIVVGVCLHIAARG